MEIDSFVGIKQLFKEKLYGCSASMGARTRPQRAAAVYDTLSIEMRKPTLDTCTFGVIISDQASPRAFWLSPADMTPHEEVKET